jgi:hypothetical protein
MSNQARCDCDVPQEHLHCLQRICVCARARGVGAPSYLTYGSFHEATGPGVGKDGREWNHLTGARGAKDVGLWRTEYSLHYCWGSWSSEA